MRRHRRGGFTLIEVMVASTLLALIGSMLLGAFNATLSSGAGADEAAESDHVARYIIKKLTEDLQSAALLPNNRQARFIGTNQGEEGRETDSIALTGYGRRAITHGVIGDQADIEWYVEKVNQRDLFLLMRRENIGMTDFAAAKDRSELFDVTDRLVSFNLRYYRQGIFQDGHRSTLQGGLPIAAEVRFILEDETGHRSTYGTIIRVGGTS